MEVTKGDLSKFLEQASEEDTRAEALLKIKEIGETLLTSQSNLISENESLKAQVQELRDANMRLFLRVTESAGEDAMTAEPEEKAPEELLAEFAENMKSIFEKE